MPSHPQLGALGLTFSVMRAMQFVSLVIIIGLSSGFVADIVGSDYAAPSALIGTLVVVSFIISLFSDVHAVASCVPTIFDLKLTLRLPL